MAILLLGCVAGLAIVAIASAASDTAEAQQPACRVPTKLGVVFVIDDSSSMTDSDPLRLRVAATEVGLDSLSDGAVAAASRFAASSRTLFSPTELTADSRPQLKRAIVVNSSGTTNYDAAFAAAKRQLDAMPAAVDRKAVIFLSDGEPTDSGFTGDRAIAAAGVPIFAVGFGEAPGDVLAGIAARSGGQAYTIQSAGEAQSTFARVVSTLNCDAVTVRDNVRLAPGEQREFPFAVTPRDEEFRTLAAWSNGAVEVLLVRPDGSELKAGTELAGERVVEGVTYSQAVGTGPAVGDWRLRVSAATSNVDEVSVSIDVFKRRGPYKTPVVLVGGLEEPNPRVVPDPRVPPGPQDRPSARCDKLPDFKRLCVALTIAGHPVYVMPGRKGGATGELDAGGWIDPNAKKLVAFIRTHVTEGPPLIVGHSMGGLIGRVAIARHKAR